MEPPQARYFLIFLTVIFLALVFFLFSQFAAPIVLAGIISILIYKWYDKLQNKLIGRKNFAALISILIIVIIIIAPTILVAVFGVKEVLNIYQTLHGYLSSRQIDLFFKSNSPLAQIIQNISKNLNINVKEIAAKEILPFFQNISIYIFSQLDTILSDIFKLALGFFVMLVTIFYLLRDGKSIENFLFKAIPLNQEHQSRLYRTFQRVSRAVFYGNFVSAFSQGFLGGLGFFIFGLGSPIFWGLIMAFMVLIPLLGHYLIFVPAAIYLLVTDKIGIALGFLIYNIIVASIVDHIIKPNLISGKIEVHPLLILISILGGLKIFGILGIIYGPLIITIFLMLLDIYIHTQTQHAE